MAYTVPRDLDGFKPHLCKADTKFRQQVGQDLLNYLAEPENSIVCQDIGQMIDDIIPWMQSSNYKVRILMLLDGYLILSVDATVGSR